MPQNDHLSSIEQEAIKRFLERLDKVSIRALPPKLSVSKARLIVAVPDEGHLYSLILSHEIFVQAAIGIFDEIHFVREGKWGCPFVVPRDQSDADRELKFGIIRQKLAAAQPHLAKAIDLIHHNNLAPLFSEIYSDIADAHFYCNEAIEKIDQHPQPDQ